MQEKEARSKLVSINVDDLNLTDIFVQNRNIMINIINACNVWIENCVLYQHDTDIMSKAKDRIFDKYLEGKLINDEDDSGSSSEGNLIF